MCRVEDQEARQPGEYRGGESHSNPMTLKEKEKM